MTQPDIQAEGSPRLRAKEQGLRIVLGCAEQEIERKSASARARMERKNEGRRLGRLQMGERKRGACLLREQCYA